MANKYPDVEAEWNNHTQMMEEFDRFRRNFKIQDILQKEPAHIVHRLVSFRGDIDLLLGSFNPINEEDRIGILSLIIHTLSHPDNAVHKAKWESLTASFKQAKALAAERKALEFISNYKMPSADKVPLSEFTTFTRTWLSSHMTTETTRAKKVATSADSFAQSNELEDILGELKVASGQ